jgi:sodium/hydrogen antiporter
VTATELTFNLWFVLVGVLLVTLALSSTVLQRLPLTTALLYLAVGVAIGPAGLGLIGVDLSEQSLFLERITEVVVIISLFSAGLKLRTPLRDSRWHIPVRLASLSMTLTVGMVALAGVYGLGLPLGAAVLLGAVLAPTDPVLASDVQVEDPRDQDRLRFGLTGEAGLNDGTAFPFVMLGLGLLGLHELGVAGWRWLLVDVLWAITGGLAIGALLGTLVGKLILFLRQVHKETVGADDFLALGLIALAYGVALLGQTYGFLAVFAAGLALRRVERLSARGKSPPDPVKHASRASGGEEEVRLATDPEHAPAYMAKAVLGFSEQLERMGTVGVVLLVGGMLSARGLAAEAIWFVPLMFLVIRPLSVVIGLLGTGTHRVRLALSGWFGVRGIGSVYYLMYAVEHELPDGLAARLTTLVLTTIAVSVVFHGISVTPLMRWYSRWTERPGTPES